MRPTRCQVPCGQQAFDIMKIIHTADIHLDSPLVGVKDPVARRLELLTALANLSRYANSHGVAAIIVAGDLFDEQYVSDRTVHGVADIVAESTAKWFVLRGNHGSRAAYDKLRQLRPQVTFFEESWSYFNLGNVTICGKEPGQNDAHEWGLLSLDPSRYNIVVLHGDIDSDSYGLIDKKTLENSNANYVALGHRHTCSQFRFGHVKACYCGVLEARGFDEPEQTGFIEIDTDADAIGFVRQAIRNIVTKRFDVTNINSEIALQNMLYNGVADVPQRQYLNVVFCGALRDGLNLHAVAKQALDGKFFALRVRDETTARWDFDALEQEISLRGKFVALARQIEDERLRADVLKLGLAALGGELDV